MAETEGFEPSIRFCRILTFQASAFDHSATSPHSCLLRPGMGAGNAFRHDVQGGMRGGGDFVAVLGRRSLWHAKGLGVARELWQLSRMSKIAFIRRAALSGAAFALLSSTASLGQGEARPRSPSQIVAEAKADEWVSIAPSDLVVMQLAADAKGRERRVVIQLMPAPFSQGWVGNIRTLVAARWYDGVSVNRVQDNYVVQWGDANGEDAAKAKALPEGLAVVPESEYLSELADNETKMYVAADVSAEFFFSPSRTKQSLDDNYSFWTNFKSGWPFAYGSPDDVGLFRWPIHCYGMVGVGRNLSPDTGTSAELYVVIGHAPRHLDRNIALVGRVIEGIEHLSSLPRGTGPLGFYESAEERVPILTVRMGDEVADLPAYEYLDTNGDSFAAYANARANRQDEFFIRPAGGADICNIPVPIRRKKA